MSQKTIRRVWMAFIAISNAVFLGYLFYYQNPGGVVAGVPESWLVLMLIMAGTFVTNTVFAWYYLGKPDVRDVFGGTRKQREDV